LLGIKSCSEILTLSRLKKNVWKEIKNEGIGEDGMKYCRG